VNSTELPVIIAGAGPVGMVAAAKLVKNGIPVRVLEKSGELSLESRASTFHPPTLDMLDDLGYARPLIEQGLLAPKVQYAATADGNLATLDFATISDLTRHPYRLQAEQFKLTRIILDDLIKDPLFSISFNTEIVGVTQNSSGVIAHTLGPEGPGHFNTNWLIGADGAGSAVRRSLDIPFEGFTWPERFLVVTTTADAKQMRPEIESVSYWADPQRWYFFLRIQGAWRVMFPVDPSMPDEVATSREFARESLASVLPSNNDLPIEHVTIYRVHQRVATTFQKGRVFLAGDAAHINNPLGGMGMNGGVHDALNLSEKLVKVIKDGEDPSILASYDRQRRAVTVDAIQVGTINNKKNLEAKTEEDQRAYRDSMRKAGSSVEGAREVLRRISMIDSLDKAASL